VFSSTTVLASVATTFACSASAAPFAFAPPIERTGIVNVVRERSAKYGAVSGTK
jgi:hypothetical protein